MADDVMTAMEEALLKLDDEYPEAAFMILATRADELGRIIHNRSGRNLHLAKWLDQMAGQLRAGADPMPMTPDEERTEAIRVVRMECNRLMARRESWAAGQAAAWHGVLKVLRRDGGIPHETFEEAIKAVRS